VDFTREINRELIKRRNVIIEKYKTGRKGEHIAETYLINHGYQIIDRNFNCCFGEIDIVAKDSDYLVFIEVKTRSNNNYGRGFNSIDFIKQKHIYKSAEYYLKRQKNGKLACKNRCNRNLNFKK